MRYDKKVTFIDIEKGKYNPATGKNNPDIEKKEELYVNVTDLGTERSVVLFGSVLENRKVIRLQQHYTKKWTCVEIDNIKYNKEAITTLKEKQTFIVKEVKNGG